MEGCSDRGEVVDDGCTDDDRTNVKIAALLSVSWYCLVLLTKTITFDSHMSYQILLDWVFEAPSVLERVTQPGL